MKKNILQFDQEQKKRIIHLLQEYFYTEWDLDIGDLKAELLIDFFTEKLGREFYNLGVANCRGFFQKKMEDLEVDMDALML
ncbi:MAG: DUF2164 domain-containing protein [Spirochaetales bacterium]|nr:DUF2164 domain-containing protein [Spirochaetales bacterium]